MKQSTGGIQGNPVILNITCQIEEWVLLLKTNPSNARYFEGQSWKNIKKYDQKDVLPVWSLHGKKSASLELFRWNFRYELIQNVGSTWFNMIQHAGKPPSLGGSQREPVWEKTLIVIFWFIGFPSKCKPNLDELYSSMYFTQALKPCKKEENPKSHSRMFAFWHGRHSNFS